MQNIKRACLGLLITTTLASLPAIARAAEDTASGTAATTAETGEILVTARRVSESLSKVPVAVSALGAEQLTARAVLAESDLQRGFPGLTVRSGQTNNLFNFSIRGQSIDLFSGSQPGVLPYYNEVQLSSFSTSGFFDLQSIQVLKGPQGTLFGRNATGGAVLFSTAKPTDKFEGSITGRVGNLNLRQVQGFINIPVVTDKVMLRVAGDLQRRDGFQYNIYQNKYHGEIDRESGRISLTLKPMERISNDTVFQYSRSRGDNLQMEAWAIYGCGQPGVSSIAACVYSPALMNNFPGGYAAFQALHPGTEAMPNGYIDQLAFQKKLGIYKVNSWKPSFHRATDWFVTNTTAFEASDAITIKNIFGVGRSKSHDSYDSEADGPFYIQNQDANKATVADPHYTGDFGAHNDVKNISDELQVVGKLDSTDFIVGAYISREKRGFYSPVSFLDVAPFGAYFGYPAGYEQIVQINDFATKDVSKALYAQVTQDLGGLTGVQGLKFTGGIRYTWETFSAEQRSRATQLLYVNSPINPAAPFEQVKNNKPSWNVSIDYQASRSLLLYAAHRGSWRSGGVNGQGPARALTAAQGGNIFAPETTYDFELGAKFNGMAGDVPVRANLAVYNQIIKNVQRVVYTAPPAEYAVAGLPALQALSVNLPKARVRGFEFDLAFNPTHWLELGGSLTHTDAKFLNGTTLLFGAPQTFGTYADTPRWAGTVYGAITAALPDDLGEVSLRGDIYSQTGQWFANQGTTQAPGTYLPGYSLVNARLDWKDVAGSPLSMALFAKNITKTEFYTGGIDIVPFGIAGVIPGEPRTYGMEVTLRF
ncbi:TonB-dependent receptor plug domain-containing protein [Novosphingobium sp. KCTC 2891]|uniref:TonB-dependent receptor n=1 Tax=Novosphingobium sp. KCTC 2891 TaxID=2989730 RepID=UPI0022230AD3|nr:TonB-dependent receptor plug domain-containing protein [Novosphingobium sp. KCTC 2891]MCW1384892.1 TonB-dependent receptor plug domain-containing protein [Novosphingobium sp. KCTC 2891]